MPIATAWPPRTQLLLRHHYARPNAAGELEIIGFRLATRANVVRMCVNPILCFTMAGGGGCAGTYNLELEYPGALFLTGPQVLSAVLTPVTDRPCASERFDLELRTNLSTPTLQPSWGRLKSIYR